MFRTVFLSIIKIFFTVHTAMVYVIHVTVTPCEQDQDGTSWSCSQGVSKPVWHTPLLCVQWKTPDDGQRNCPKHVEFYSKNKFEKLVHLVGFIIRSYHDARSPERQIWWFASPEQWRCFVWLVTVNVSGRFEGILCLCLQEFRGPRNTTRMSNGDVEGGGNSLFHHLCMSGHKMSTESWIRQNLDISLRLLSVYQL